MKQQQQLSKTSCEKQASTAVRADLSTTTSMLFLEMSNITSAYCTYHATSLSKLCDIVHIYTYDVTGVPVVKKLQLQKLKSLRKSAKADRAILAFDLQADLALAFNWNIKQVCTFIQYNYCSVLHLIH
jgi:Signal peptidase subunit